MTDSVPEDLRRRLEAVCAAIGCVPGPFRLIKFTNNAVFELPDAGIVVRIAGSEAMHHRARKIVTVGRWLEDFGFPAIRLQPGIDQPVAAGPDLATIWIRARPTGPKASIADLGGLLKRFHQLPAPVNDGLPVFDPVADVRARLDRADGVDHDDLAFLRARCDDLEDQLGGAAFALPRGPIHGDAHTGNLIRTTNGVLLSDFDSTCIGPPEWDLVPTLFGTTRFGDPTARVDELAHAYGTDPRDLDSGVDVLMRLRELKLVTSVVPVLNTNPRVVEQFRTRLRSIRDADSSARWSRY